jgi:hypothetical protein
MSLSLSHVFAGVAQQQFVAMINILNKAAEFAADTNSRELELLEKRLADDMHPLHWQVQTFCELGCRGVARLCGDEPQSLQFNEKSFAALAARVEESRQTVENADDQKLDLSVTREVTIPIGPEATLTLNGEDYVLKFLLPNIYFHLTTTYNILRSAGVELGKRDFMGPVV